MPRFPALSNWLLLVVLVGCVGVAWWGMDVRVRSLMGNTALLIVGVELLAIPLGVLLAVALAKTNCPAAALGLAAVGHHAVCAAVHGGGCVGRRVRHPRLAHAGHESAPGPRAVAERLASRDLDSRDGGRAVGRR